jgi:hypothetical protein
MMVCASFIFTFDGFHILELGMMTFTSSSS